MTQALLFCFKMEFTIREYYISCYERKRRYGDDHYKCATGDVEKGSTLEGLADGYRCTE